MKCNSYDIKLGYSTKIVHYSQFMRATLIKQLTDTYDTIQEGVNYLGEKYILVSDSSNIVVPLYDDDSINNIIRLNEILSTTITAYGIYTSEIIDLVDAYNSYNDLTIKISMYTEQLKALMTISKYTALASKLNNCIDTIESLNSTVSFNDASFRGVVSSLNISYWADARFCSLVVQLDNITKIDWS